MLKNSAKHSLFFVVATMLFASVEASARNSVTCSGGHLYLEQSHPDGDICWNTGLTCNGEWTYSWSLVKKSDGGGNVATSRMIVGTTQDIVKMLSSLKQSDLKLFYQAQSSIVTSFKQRKGWPGTSKGNIEIPEGTLPTWLEDLAIKKSSGADSALNSATGYPPHGYPCLGCHPCPPDYCDDANKRMQASDLAPAFIKQGYGIKDGKIGKVSGVPSGSIKPVPLSTPNVYRLDSKDPNSAKKCTDGGGVVATDKDGQSVCAIGYKQFVGRGCNVPPCVRRPGGCICP